MDGKPTMEQLATVAGMFGSKVSPDAAVKRALQLFEAADRLLLEDEIADEEEMERLKTEGETAEGIGLGSRGEKMSIADAFQVQKEIAASKGATAFKTESGFSKAMRDAKLMTTEQVPSLSTEEWIKSPEPEMPIAETRELTSRQAVEEFFKVKARERKTKDHDRHQKNKTAVKGKFLENRARAKGSEKRNRKQKKRSIQAKSERLRGKAKLSK